MAVDFVKRYDVDGAEVVHDMNGSFAWTDESLDISAVTHTTGFRIVSTLGSGQLRPQQLERR